MCAKNGTPPPLLEHCRLVLMFSPFSTVKSVQAICPIIFYFSSTLKLLVVLSGNGFSQVVNTPSGIIWYRSHGSNAYCREVNPRYGVAMVMRHRVKWFMIHVRAQRLKRERDTPATLLYGQRRIHIGVGTGSTCPSQNSTPYF